MDQPRITLFGQPALRVRETPGAIPHAQQVGLLAYLALEAREHPVPRERLIELFWPGVSLDLARHSLPKR